MIKCKAAIATGDGHYQVAEITVSDPLPDEVIVQVKAAGLCHTDLDSLNWGKPIVMGHEGAGIVHKTGSNVTSVKEGDRVILNWATPCNECFQCDLGNHHICENNSPVVAGANGATAGHAHLEGTKWQDRAIERSFNIGTISEYTLVKDSALVKLESDVLDFPAASIVSCGVMTGVGSVLNSANFKAGSSTVVIGTGGVGLNAIQGAKIGDASMIIAIDISQDRLDMAVKFGATHTYLVDKNDTMLEKAADHVKSLTNGRGVDYAFECTAIPRLGAAPLAMVRNAGTAVQVSGIEQEISIDMHLFEWDKIYINPLYGSCSPAEDFPKLVNYHAEGKLLLDEMVTQTYTLDQLEAAFKDLHDGVGAKTVIVF